MPAIHWQIPFLDIGAAPSVTVRLNVLFVNAAGAKAVELIRPRKKRGAAPVALLNPAVKSGTTTFCQGSQLTRLLEVSSA